MRLITIEVSVLVPETISRIIPEAASYRICIRSYISRKISFNQILLNIHRFYFDYILAYICYISYLCLKIPCFDKKWNFLVVDKYENAYRPYIKYSHFQIRFFHCFYPTLILIVFIRR